MDLAKRRYLPLLVAAVAILLLAAAAGSGAFNQKGTQPAQGREVVRIGYLPVIATLPLAIAVQDRLFESANVDAQLVRFDSSNTALDALVAGKIDVLSVTGTYQTWAAADRDANAPFRVFGFGVLDANLPGQYGSELLAAKDNRAINGVSDLKGKKIGVFPSANSRVILGLALKSVNMTTTDVSMVDLNPGIQLSALKAGTVDALWTLEPVGTIGDAQGISRMVEMEVFGRYAGSPYPSATFLVSNVFAAERPQAAKDVVEAFDKAINLTNRGWRQRRRLLTKYIPGLSNDTADRLPVFPFWATSSIDDSQVSQLQASLELYWREGMYANRPNATALLMR